MGQPVDEEELEMDEVLEQLLDHLIRRTERLNEEFPSDQTGRALLYLNKAMVEFKIRSSNSEFIPRGNTPDNSQG